MSTSWILFALSFICYTFARVSSHPNKALSDSEFTWSPKNSENDVDVGEIEELDNEYDFNDVDFDEDDDGNFDHYSISNNKRSPNSVGESSFKNKAGYYLVEGSGHTVQGTTDIATCNKNGVFEVGKIQGVPFLRNKLSRWYLAISSSGQVYMTPTRNNDTVIRTFVSQDGTHVYLYRKVKNPKKYFYLDISPLGNTVQNSVGNTALFRVRMGKSC